MQRGSVVRDFLAERVATKFHTRKELQDYLHEHPDADRSEHSVMSPAEKHLDYEEHKKDAASPKVEFFTPATFKHVAEHFRDQLKHGTGYDWYTLGVQKNNRKVHGGQELYFSAKLAPADKTKPLQAEVEASLTSGFGGQVLFVASARLERSFKQLFEAQVQPATFAEVQHFFAGLSIPAHAFEAAKTASTLAERVVERYFRSVKTHA